MSNAQQVSNIVSDLKGDICIIFNALKKFEKIDEDENKNQADEMESGDMTDKTTVATLNSNTPKRELISTNETQSNVKNALEKTQNEKLIRNFKRLEEAFRNLSIDFHDY